MKTHNLSKGFAFVLLFFCFNLQGVKAQCSFVKLELTGEKTTTILPCNFPMLNFTKATPHEKQEFLTQVANWKIKNKGFDNLTFTPITTQEYFEIEQTVYDSFSDENKAIVAAMPFFYKIKSKTTIKTNK